MARIASRLAIFGPRAILTFFFKFVHIGNVVDDAVNEAARALVAEGLRQLDRLIDRHARRNVGHMEQLEHGEAKNIVIDARQALHRPMLERVGDLLVEFALLFAHALDERVGEHAHLAVVIGGLEQRREVIARRPAAYVDSIKSLERQLAAHVSASHKKITETQRGPYTYVISFRSEKRCPSFSFLVRRYPILPLCGATSSGTRVTFTP